LAHESVSCVFIVRKTRVPGTELDPDAVAVSDAELSLRREKPRALIVRGKKSFAHHPLERNGDFAS
jgi:hypothetical protein